MTRTRTNVTVCCIDPADPGATRRVVVPGIVLDGTVWAVTPILGKADVPVRELYTVTHVPTGRTLVAPGMGLPAAAVADLVEGLAADVPRWGADLPLGYGVTQGGRDGTGAGATAPDRARPGCCAPSTRPPSVRQGSPPPPR